MTTRDRLALIGIASLALLAVVWLLLVSPERKQASAFDKQLSAANAQLASAEGEAVNARAAKSHYAAAYASVVNLGKAVPPSDEVPSLIYQLAQSSNQRHVEFNSISSSSTGTGTSTAPSTSTAATAAGFTQMPFTFVFDGSFDDLYHLFVALDKSTVQTPAGLQVSGRLLTLQSVKLEPKATNEASSGGLTGTITATAYVLPAGQGLTAGATPASPTTSSAATTASSGAATASGPPAAVVSGGPVR
jgi:Tfp pilus assembly protein PilO